MTRLTLESQITWWRERVDNWRYVKIPISIGLIVLTLGGFVASLVWAPNAWLALLWVFPFAMAVLALHAAIEGWRFAAGVLAEAEERITPAGFGSSSEETK